MISTDESVEFPDYSSQGDYAESKMRIYLARLLINQPDVTGEENHLEEDYKSGIRLTRNQFEACVCSYLKIREIGLSEYVERHPSSNWDVKTESDCQMEEDKF
jgi:hypothetical protein